MSRYRHVFSTHKVNFECQDVAFESLAFFTFGKNILPRGFFEKSSRNEIPAEKYECLSWKFTSYFGLPVIPERRYFSKEIGYV